MLSGVFLFIKGSNDDVGSTRAFDKLPINSFSETMELRARRSTMFVPLIYGRSGVVVSVVHVNCVGSMLYGATKRTVVQGIRSTS